MKSIKKLTALFAVAALALSLMAGCSNESPTTAAGEGAAAESTAAAAEAGTVDFIAAENAVAPAFDGLKGTKEDGKQIKIGFTIAANDQYGALMSTAMIKKAEELGAQVNLVESKENDNTMISQIEQFTTDGSDVIICQLTNTTTAQQAIDAAGGIPIIFLNRIPEGQFKGNAYYVGSDDLEAGMMQGQALAKFFGEAGKKEISLVQLTGNVGATNANFRTEGVLKALEEAGIKVTYALNDTAKWQRQDANNVMQTFLGTGTAYDAVACNNDEMALGAILAMKAAGVDLAAFPVVGVDATKDGKLAVESGELFATVFQDAKGQGEGALAVALTLANGGQAPVKVSIPFVLIDKSNIAEYIDK